MIRYILSVIVLLWALLAFTSPVWAGCTMQSYTINGKFISCLVCCDSMGNCTTSCFGG